MVLRKEIVVVGLSMEDFKNNNVLDRSEVRCPIAAASTVLTDQWSVIVIRDIAFFGFRTFREIISNNNEKIQSSTLAKRLKRLVDVGLLSFKDDETHAQRKIYCLTQAAIDLVPIIISMAYWSNKHQILDSHTIEFLKPLQEKNNPALEEFVNKLRKEHLY